MDDPLVSWLPTAEVLPGCELRRVQGNPGRRNGRCRPVRNPL